jgi:hypothetical protein
MPRALAPARRDARWALALCSCLAASAGAETLRPLVTEDVETLEDGMLEAQIAVEAVTDFQSPFTDAHGPLLRFPVLAVNYGLGDRAEVQVRAPLYVSFSPDDLPSQHGSGDLTVATKVRFFGGRGWPGLGARCLIKLPNLPETTGIGSDETDVTLELLTGLELGGTAVAANVGLAILGNPLAHSAQVDKLVLGAGAVLPLGLLDVAGDLHAVLGGGDEAIPDEWSALVGGARDIGDCRLDAGLGIVSRAEERSFALTFGATLLFDLGTSR